MVNAFVVRKGRSGEEPAIPTFTYTGSYRIIDDGDRNWRIKFFTSGTFTPTSNIGSVDLFLVGGGASGNRGGYGYGGGGGGGYTRTIRNIYLEKDTPYTVTIGAGGANPGSGAYVTSRAGGTTTAFGYSAAGGTGGYFVDKLYGGGTDGGSGGGGNGAGGSDGYNGSGGTGAHRQGQRNLIGPNGETGSTREFGESGGTLYAGGGGGNKSAGGAGGGGTSNSTGAAVCNGVVNTGGGGAGPYQLSEYGGTVAGTGGSGIAIIRNART